MKLGSNLSDQRGTQTSLTELHNSVTYLFVLGNQRTDTDSTFRITFRNGVNQNHIILDAFQMAGRNIGRTGIDKFAIYFIGEKE